MEAVADVRSRGLWVIIASFVVALVLSMVSMSGIVPQDIGYLRPEWVLLTLIYWIIALPHRIGIVSACLLGILVDVLSGSLLGQHSVAFIIVAYIAGSLYQRLRMFSVWQQSLIVLVLVGLSQLINIWIENVAGAEFSWWYLLPAVVSAFAWPWIFLALRYLRRRFNVN